MNILGYLERKKLEIEERYFLQELQAFYVWAAQNLLVAQVIVFLRLPATKFIVLAKNSNSQKGYSTKNSKRDSQMPVSFIVCVPGGFPDCQKALGGKESISQDDWQPIFRSARIEIWENKKHHDVRRLPLCFGFSDEEKEKMLRFVRMTIGQTLQRQDSLLLSGNFSERFDEKVSIDVALWVGGHLRSSMIVKDMPLKEALKKAAHVVPFDGRFKPILLDELSRARIEITVMHSLRLPLSFQELTTNTIDTTKGYRMAYQSLVGWFLPEVFNCVRFENLQDFLKRLAREKAKIPANYLRLARVELFEVDDFIESFDTSSVLSLAGPVVKETASKSTNFDKSFIANLESCMQHSLAQLVFIQEKDGNIPSRIDPLTAEERQIDWVRLPLTAGALILGGQALNMPLAVKAGEKALEYFHNHFENLSFIPLSTKLLSLAYYAKTLLISGEKEEANKAAEEIYRHVDALDYDPIAYFQVASLFLSFGKETEKFRHKGEAMLFFALRDFENRLQKNEKIPLAFFPEAINGLLRLYNLTQKDEWRDKACRIAEWHVQQQLSDGSFPNIPGSSFSYTRGTGKIFETLTLLPGKNKETIFRVFGWLRKMQYNEGNMYFVPEERKPRIIGGFRHDALNQEVWVDASSHILIGGARLLSWLKTGDGNMVF
ncbi:MAG: AMMECR1 domain-containing protein [Candidatus Moranbacteria bacterium]|nr:AMMECR1 domain-containing protein [Candidatus Moranbacteria bacterium]